MSYSPPPVSGIDFSGLSAGYSAPSATNIDLTAGSAPSNPEGIVDATLPLSAALIGSASTEGVISAGLGISGSLAGAHHTGQLSAGLDLDASFSGILGSQSVLNASLGFSASFTGETAGLFGSISAGLEFSAGFRGFQDWTEGLDPRQLREFYTLTITGSPDLVFRISSWQATARSGENSNYLQAVIPGASGRLEEIQERSGGELIVSKGYRFSDGSERSEEIMRSDFSSFRYDEGPRQLTATVSGYGPGFVSSQNTRPLKGLRSLNFSDGKFRARCSIDLFLRPGMTVQARNAEFTVDFINYYVSRADKFCEVGQS